MKELQLLRHGKSDWNVDASDFERPLKARGEEESTRVGHWLRSGDKVPELVLSSPAVRARATAELCCEAMGLPQSLIVLEDNLYLADLATLRDYIADINGAVNRLLLIGHNPGLESLLLFLAGKAVAKMAGRKVLPTATVAGLSFEGEWQKLPQETCRLDYIRRGRLL